MEEFAKELLKQGPVVAAAAVALIYFVRKYDRLNEAREIERKQWLEKQDARDKEWQQKFDTLYERHAIKAENFADKGNDQGDRLNRTMEQILEALDQVRRKKERRPDDR